MPRLYRKDISGYLVNYDREINSTKRKSNIKDAGVYVRRKSGGA